MAPISSNTYLNQVILAYADEAKENWISSFEYSASLGFYLISVFKK